MTHPLIPQLAQFRTEMDTLLTELGNLEEHNERGHSRRRCATQPTLPVLFVPLRSSFVWQLLQEIGPKLSAGR